jgi:hypothetical protein
MRHCISAWDPFGKLGICDGKETMFPRMARRRIPLPGWMGVFIAPRHGFPGYSASHP